MRRKTAALWAVLALSLSATQLHAAGPKVVLDHKVTGVTKGESGATVDYALHVTNPGTLPLTEVTLTLVPHSPFIRKKVTLSVGSLAPHQEATVPLQIVTPFNVDAERASRSPLFWSGSYTDQEGKQVKFPAVSKPGGAK